MEAKQQSLDPSFVIFSCKDYRINHDLFVQLFCQYQLYLLCFSKTQSYGLSPRDYAGGVTASGGENGFAHVQPYFPLRFLLQLIVSDHLVGMKMANFAHEIDPLSMENRYTA